METKDKELKKLVEKINKRNKELEIPFAERMVKGILEKKDDILPYPKGLGIRKTRFI